MDVFGLHVIKAVHPDVAMIHWGDGDESEPTPMEFGAGCFVASVYMVEHETKGPVLAWRDITGQRIYLKVEELPPKDGAPTFRSSDPERLPDGKPHTFQIFGADEALGIVRIARTHEVPDLAVDEVPYALMNLAMMGDDSDDYVRGE